MEGAKRAATIVLNSLIAKVGEKIDELVTLASWAAVAIVAVAVALIFFTYAAFVWLEQNYGAIDAALILGAIFLFIAAVIALTILLIRRRSPPRKRGTPQWWKDPAIVATGVELVRIVGLRRIIPVVALGIVIAEALKRAPDRAR